MWPFTRKLEIVVRHEIVGLDAVAEAIVEFADAHRYAAKVGGGLVRAKMKDAQTDPPEWELWEADHDYMDETERLHLRWAYDVLRGAERVPQEKRMEAANLYRKAQEAGYGLPEIDDGRVPVDERSER